MTDGSVNENGYPQMSTNQLWQSIVWLLTWPTKNHICINALSLNINDINITWHLTTRNKHKIKSKYKVAKGVNAFTDEEFSFFLLAAVLGDGSVYKNAIVLAVSDSKYESLWKNITNKMAIFGFRSTDSDYLKLFRVFCSKATALVQRWLSNVLIKAMIEDLAQLPDADKLRNIIILANKKDRPLGKSSVSVAGVRMTISINQDGYVELRAFRRNFERAKTVLERLKDANFNPKIRGRNRRFEIYIKRNEIKSHPELLAKVCEILKKMLEDAIRNDDKRRIEKISKAIISLGCQKPAQGPWA